MSTDEGVTPEREYRLHWLTPARRHPGLSDPEGAETCAWVGSDDPRALQRWAAAREWPEDAVVTVSIEPPGNADDRRSHCTPAEFAAWDPEAAELPASTREAPRPGSPSRDRLELFRAARSATDAAVSAGVLAPDLADAILIATREAVEETRRRGRAGAEAP